MSNERHNLGPEEQHPLRRPVDSVFDEPKANRQPTRLATSIKLFLASRDIDQKEFAEYVRASQSTITRFLRGECTPEAVTVLRIISWMMELDA